MGRVARASVLAMGMSLLGSGDAAAQAAWASPEIGWSEIRGLTVGARVGRELVGGLDIVMQSLWHFPDETGIVDPGASAQRSSWQASANLTYAFDRTRPISPYVGLGTRYGRATLTVVSGGYRAGQVRTGFGVNYLGGVRLPRLPWTPWIELRGGEELWTLTGGVQWRFGGH